jgi:hypothetical protein
VANPTLKFALSGYPERYVLPPRPADAHKTKLDAHRQTQFLLSEDLTWFERAMNCQVGIVAANRKSRDPHVAMLFAYWARVFYYLSGACSAVCFGSYPSCPPLLRAACDCLAAQRALIADGFADADGWIPSAVSRATDDGALAIDIGRFRAASVLAEDQTLGRLYRIVGELSMPSFGGTLLQTSPDTTVERASISFAEGSFHLAWAQLCMGWLLPLSFSQLQTIAESQLFTIDERLLAEIEQIVEGVETTLGSPQRCNVEEHGDGGFLLHNYRRTTGGQPKRVLLR